MPDHRKTVAKNLPGTRSDARTKNKETVVATAAEPITQPTIPPSGDADSLAGEETNSSKTPATDSKTTIVVSEEEELRELCAEADAKAKELIGPYHALQVRISGELFPILLQIKTLLPHGEWTPWYESFCKRHHITTSIRTVQRGFAELTGDRLLTNGSGSGIGSSSCKQSSPAVEQAAKLLAEAKDKFGKAAEGGSEQAKAAIAQYEKEYDDAIAKVDGLGGRAAKAVKPVVAETRINKRLAAIVEIAERYIRVMERVVNAATPTDRQQRDIEKTRESWRKVLQDARTLSWAVKVIDEHSQEHEEEENAA